MSHSLTRTGRAMFVALAALFAIALSSPAYASGETYNNAEISIKGGNAAALNGCMNYAKALAKVNRPAQSNICQNFATATGGTVTLESVFVTVIQEGTGSRTHNNAEVSIEGGDATAVSSCVNYLQGTANASQKNQCANKANATGGDVNLSNVDITIIQG